DHGGSRFWRDGHSPTLGGSWHDLAGTGPPDKRDGGSHGGRSRFHPRGQIPWKSGCDRAWTHSRAPSATVRAVQSHAAAVVGLSRAWGRWSFPRLIEIFQIRWRLILLDRHEEAIGA